MRGAVLLGVVMTCLIAISACEANWQAAEQKAREYASANFPGYEVVNVSCERFDTDNNGRVRCNLSVKNPTSNEIVTPPVECPATYSGCGGGNMCQVPRGI